MTIAGLQWALPWFLLLLPLALLPWFNHNLDKTVAWVNLVPVDPLSVSIDLFLKLMTSLLIACLLFALAGPSLPEQTVERVGEGAEIVLLLDRSRSMDEPFAVTAQAASVTPHGPNSRRNVSRVYLTEFVRKRPDDRFGFVFFSSQSINLLPLTYSKEAILATINASALGRGLSETNVANALVGSAEMFEGQTYRGSRIILLVSDGGVILSEEEEQSIKDVFRQKSLSLYWIYLKPRQGMTLEATENESILYSDTPERKLHEFFQTMDVPYRAFEADSLQDFSEAMDEIDRQQYQPLIVEEILPREMKADVFLWIALFAMLILSASHFYTYWGVRKAHE